MSYNNLMEQPSQNIPATSNSKNHIPPQPTQGMNHSLSGLNGVSGINSPGVSGGVGGGGGTSGGGVGAGLSFPTPVGHQADLAFLMSMIEELSKVLQTNQNLTAGVVSRIGKVREKAKHMNLKSDELLTEVASKIDNETSNIEKENSELRLALNEAEFDKKENWKLAVHGANILADLTEKLHRFKELHELDTLTWHKNYRKQLAEEREENLNLRCQIDDMKAAACKANQSLRDMRRYVTENNEWHELRIQNNSLRQEKRYWKRLALPLIPDDDSEWSDDDDLIDPEEKKRQACDAAEIQKTSGLQSIN